MRKRRTDANWCQESRIKCANLTIRAKTKFWIQRIQKFLLNT